MMIEFSLTEKDRPSQKSIFKEDQFPKKRTVAEEQPNNICLDMQTLHTSALLIRNYRQGFKW